MFNQLLTSPTVKNNKSAGSNSIVGELAKYGGKRVCEMLTLFSLFWNNEHVYSY